METITLKNFTLLQRFGINLARILVIRGRNKWFNFPIVEDEQQKLVFDKDIIVNHPSLHDAVEYSCRRKAGQILFAHRLWKERYKIGIIILSTEEAGNPNDLWDLNSVCKLVWLDPQNKIP